MLIISKNEDSTFSEWLVMLLCYVDLGWLPDTHPAALLLPLCNRTRGENKMKNLMDWDKDIEITKQFYHQGQNSLDHMKLHTSYCQIKLIWKEKNKDKVITRPSPYTFFPQAYLHPFITNSLPPPPPTSSRAGWMGNGYYSQFIPVHLCHSVLLQAVLLLQHGVTSSG